MGRLNDVIVSQLTESLADRVIRRLATTSGECRAVLRLANRRTGEWYDWESCTNRPGHAGRHEAYSERDQAVFVEWGNGQPPVPPVNQEYRELESPWMADEIAYLARMAVEDRP